MLRRWYTVLDTGSVSSSYAGVIMGLDWTDAMGTAGRILGYPDTFERIEIFECDILGQRIPGGDSIQIRPTS
jgi:hypothetical protein